MFRDEAASVPGVSPCWSHALLVEQIRDIPLIKPPERPRKIHYLKVKRPPK